MNPSDYELFKEFFSRFGIEFTEIGKMQIGNTTAPKSIILDLNGLFYFDENGRFIGEYDDINIEFRERKK